MTITHSAPGPPVQPALRAESVLQASHGSQWSANPDETFDWMIHFIDHGLRSAPAQPTQALEATS